MRERSAEISNSQSEHVTLQQGAVIELRKMFPISPRLLIREVFRLLAILAALCLLLTVVSNSSGVIEQMDNKLSTIDPHTDPDSAASFVVADFDTLLSSLIIGLALWIVIKGLYLFFYHRTYNYILQDDQLVLRKGVLARETIIVPVARTTQLYVERNILDFILGIAHVIVTAPGVQRQQSIIMPGLRHSTALKLEAYLAREMKNSG